MVGLQPYKWISKFKGLRNLDWALTQKEARLKSLMWLKQLFKFVQNWLQLLRVIPSDWCWQDQLSSVSGETIDKIIAETSVKIDIDEKKVMYLSLAIRCHQPYKEIIAGLVREAKGGQKFTVLKSFVSKFGASASLIRQMPCPYLRDGGRVLIMSKT